LHGRTTVSVVSKERIRGKALLEAKRVLSPLDHFEAFFFIEMVFYFQEALPAEELKASLRKTLELFPLLCGRLQQEPSGQLSISKMTDGVLFAVCECDRRLPEPAATGCIPYNALPFVERLNPFVMTRENYPLAAFKLTRMAGGGCALGVSMAHALTDGLGFFSFLQCWSQVHSGAPPGSPLFDRTVIDPGAGMPPAGCRGFKYVSRYWLLTFLVKVFRCRNNMASSIIHFTDAELNAIKQEGAHDGRISLSDALSARLWKWYCGLTGPQGEKKRRMLQPVNIRKTAGQPGAERYFGNAVSHSMCEKSAREIAAASVADLAAEWRRALQAVDASHVAGQMRWLRRHEEGKKLYRVFADVDPFSGDLFITNSSKLPVHDVSFDGRQPFRVEMPVIPIPGAVLLLAAPGGTGINMYTHFPRPLTERLQCDPDPLRLSASGARTDEG